MKKATAIGFPSNSPFKAYVETIPNTDNPSLEHWEGGAHPKDIEAAKALKFPVNGYICSYASIEDSFVPQGMDWDGRFMVDHFVFEEKTLP